MAARERVICAAGALAEGGRGVRFALRAEEGAPTGFAVRHGGAVHAYVNRCPHMGTELDWQPGEFLDAAGLYLVCATHGALFQPATGLCVAGPCRGASLERLPTREDGGRIHLIDEAAAPPEDSP
ncbi:MAG TPA: Rieske (2Fe-2S) protein [Usitatibacter sp.]|nr:Rieske (2Fe-2S) protein [Usitatibacter sp.]